MHIRDCHNPKCGIAFPVKSPSSTQKYCSRSCASSANAAKRKPKVKKNRRALRTATELMALPSTNNTTIYTLTCAHCKTTFTKKRKERYCSSMCRSFATHVKPMTNVVDLTEIEAIQESTLPAPLFEPPSKAS